MTLDGDRSVHIEYIRYHVHQVVNSPSQKCLVRINMSLSETYQPRNPKNMANQKIFLNKVVALLAWDRPAILVQCMKSWNEARKVFLLNANQAGTFIVIHGTSKIFPLSSPPIFPPLVKRFERPICGSFTLSPFFRWCSKENGGFPLYAQW